MRSYGGGGLSSSLILRFPPNFVRQLSTKARRNCSNIGVAQVVAASWSNNPAAAAAAAKAVDATSAALAPVEVATGVEEGVLVEESCSNDAKKIESLSDEKSYSFLSCDGSIAIHAGAYFSVFFEILVLDLLV